MAKKPRTPDDDAEDLPENHAKPHDDHPNQGQQSNQAAPPIGNPGAGNPPSGAGRPTPENQAEQDRQTQANRPDDPDRQQTQAEKDADKPPLAKEEALQLLKAGHRLRIKGEDPANWIAMTRHGGDLALSVAATDPAIDDALSNDLILADQ